jgi:TRAP-type C4-dicarboxylate transport system permease small subunit
VTIATCVMLAIFAWPMLTMFAELDQRSETANIPLVIPEAVVPIGLMLMALLIAVRLITLGTRHGTTISAREVEH